MTTLPEARPASGLRRRQFEALADRLRYPLGVYVLSRAVLILPIAAVVIFGHWPIADTQGQITGHLTGWGLLGRGLANWDGQWYLRIFSEGYQHYNPPPSWWPAGSVYPHHLFDQWTDQTTLGFLPLYPMLMWLVANVFLCGPTVAGMLIALVTGGIATVLVDQLAREWWGDERTVRRVVAFFCFFPGSIVFSMVYTEGLLLTLVCGCILALQHRRWLLAGVLAGLSTAVGPVAEAIIPTCIVASGLEIYRYGWRDREARRSLIAPLLSPAGLIGFGIFLWFWVGTPLASYKNQRYGWSESTTPLAVWRMGRSLYYQVRDQITGHLGAGSIDLNLIAGLLGTVFLIYCLVRLWRDRRRIGWPALTWTVFVALLTLTSQKTPPNARLLICAFPAVMIFAAKIRGRRAWIITMTVTIVLLLVMSYLSYYLSPLRP